MEDGESDRLASEPESGDGYMGGNSMDTNHTAADAQEQSNTLTESLHAPTASPNQSSEQKRQLGLFGGMGNWTDKRLRKLKQYFSKKFQ